MRLVLSCLICLFLLSACKGFVAGEISPERKRLYERNNNQEYCEQNPEVSLSPLERNPSSYDQAVAQLVEAIRDRGAYLDTHIEALYANCHASVNKQ